MASFGAGEKRCNEATQLCTGGREECRPLASLETGFFFGGGALQLVAEYERQVPEKVKKEGWKCASIVVD